MEKALCLGVWAWEAGSFLGFGLLQLCQGAEQHFQSLALGLCGLIKNSERIFPWMALLYVNIAFLAGIHRYYIIPNVMLTSKASYRSTSSLARFPLSPYFSDRTGFQYILATLEGRNVKLFPTT